MCSNKIAALSKREGSDLVEIFYFNLEYESWSKLFDWISNKLLSLDCQFGRLDTREIDFEAFWEDRMSYIAHIQMSSMCEYSLLVLEKNELTFSVEVSDIDNDQKFSMFLADVKEIASVLSCNKYIVCPEFEQESAFIVNGSVV